jgi:hypothetical protein
MNRHELKHLIVLILCFVLIGRLTYQIQQSKHAKYFAKKEMVKTNTIYHIDADPMLDTIVAVGLQIYQIDNIKIGIRYTSDHKPIKAGKYQIDAYTVNEGDCYVITLIETDRKKSIELIAHELTHVRQIYDKRIIVDGEDIIWKGKHIKPIPEYMERPWEIEAFQYEVDLAQRIENALYQYEN